MKILAIETELDGADWEHKEETLRREAHRAYERYQEGFIRELYFNQHHNAVLILECESVEKATAVLSTLPLVKKGWIAFNLMPLTPYTGFERLMTTA